MYLDEVFNMNIDMVFQCLFTDSTFFRNFVDSRKTFGELFVVCSVAAVVTVYFTVCVWGWGGQENLWWGQVDIQRLLVMQPN